MTDTPLLRGLRIRFERTKDVPCAACGRTVVVVSLHCATCDRNRGWPPETVVDLLMETIKRFDRPTEAITIRNPEFAQANATVPLGATRSQLSAP